MEESAQVDVSPDAPLSVGDAVHVKEYGRAVVAEALQVDPARPFHNRLRVQYPDGKSYWARRANLRRIVSVGLLKWATCMASHAGNVAHACCHYTGTL